MLFFFNQRVSDTSNRPGKNYFTNKTAQLIRGKFKLEFLRAMSRIRSSFLSNGIPDTFANRRRGNGKILAHDPSSVIKGRKLHFRFVVEKR